MKENMAYKDSDAPVRPKVDSKLMNVVERVKMLTDLTSGINIVAGNAADRLLGPLLPPEVGSADRPDDGHTLHALDVHLDRLEREIRRGYENVLRLDEL